MRFPIKNENKKSYVEVDLSPIKKFFFTTITCSLVFSGIILWIAYLSGDLANTSLNGWTQGLYMILVVGGSILLAILFMRESDVK